MRVATNFIDVGGASIIDLIIVVVISRGMGRGSVNAAAAIAVIILLQLTRTSLCCILRQLDQTLRISTSPSMHYTPRISRCNSKSPNKCNPAAQAYNQDSAHPKMPFPVTAACAASLDIIQNPAVRPMPGVLSSVEREIGSISCPSFGLEPP